MDKNKLKKIKIGIVFLVIIAIAFCANKVWAYFTTYCEAKGSQRISIGTARPVVEKRNANNNIYIAIRNDGDADCYARIKIFANSKVQLIDNNSTKWNKSSDGYWYYTDVLSAGSRTSEIQIPYTQTNASDDIFSNIVIINEATRVLYNGQTPSANWESFIY